ncbi:MAG: hypothetical protein M1818_006305 [Claussenomyces sp. TS43310]|nr:MAG: hypothetical protein M1818_006305 [Claussenomyces sp. TS43310]
MQLRILVSSLWTLSFALTCSAFLRTVPDKSPYDYTFAQYGGVPDAADAIKYNYTKGIKSYWWANFLHGDDGHDYCVVITSANAGAAETVSSMSIINVNTGFNFATAINEAGQLSNSKFSGISSVLTAGSTAADGFSENYAISSLPEFPFNLSYIPRGPNLYQGGLGAFMWGTDFAYALDAPETYVTGWFEANGTKVNVVPEQSMAWFDFQWGPGYAISGWHDYVILLENGVKLQVTVTTETDLYKQGSFANMLYPDGHMEIWPVDNNTAPTNPWVSSLSNITYYSNYIVSIPLKNTVLFVDLPVKGGETGPSANATAANTIADTFAWYSGTFEGLPVRGWGIMELRGDAQCASYGGC